MVAPPSERRVALASGNPHKAREWQDLLPGWDVATLDMSQAPPESGSTFSENAISKARYGALLAPPGLWVMGEDSGLEVDALGGAPGIRSARFASPGASDAENLAKLLAQLGNASERRAQFTCEVGCVSPTGDECHASGAVSGHIAGAVSGEGGFGYDPIFVPDGETRTVADLGATWKGRHSHRAQAAAQVLKLLNLWYPDD